jgi:Asp-tRNA(Asn)/Glu-tRNA(Gln) amidotransferase A subunit family amidase
VGLAWLEEADPLVRERVGDVALSLGATRVDFPLLPQETHAAFMSEAADVHRDLHAERGQLYGENVRTKVERCLAVTPEEATAARAARAEYSELCLRLTDGLDLLVTPTLAFVAPPAGIGDLALREPVLRFTYPFSSLGWPALALPCGPAEHGLPASVQIVGKPGDDGLVLAVGLSL